MKSANHEEWTVSLFAFDYSFYLTDIGTASTVPILTLIWISRIKLVILWYCVPAFVAVWTLICFMGFTTDRKYVAEACQASESNEGSHKVLSSTSAAEIWFSFSVKWCWWVCGWRSKHSTRQSVKIPVSFYSLNLCCLLWKLDNET